MVLQVLSIVSSKTLLVLFASTFYTGILFYVVLNETRVTARRKGTL